MRIAEGGVMKTIISNPRFAALIGLLFTLPFLVLNAIVGSQIEPFLTFIRPTGHTSNFEYFLLAVVLLLLPIGALVVANPMWQKRKFFFVNTVLALIMLSSFVAISVGLGSDIYRCDVLQIANCD
jgi:hypothetical protein